MCVLKLSFRLNMILSFSLMMGRAQADSTLDVQLTERLQHYRVQALTPLKIDNSKLYELGKNLFFDKTLSYKSDVSCSSCHSPRFGLSTGSAFAIGTGGLGSLPHRQALALDQYTSRNAPSLFNLGRQTSQFWDSRVQYDPRTRSLFTPEKGLNGTRPYLKDISRVLRLALYNESDPSGFLALAAQTLFPIAAVSEMRSNQVKSLNNSEYWALISDRVNGDKAPAEYLRLFQEAFGADESGRWNIGHVAVALGYFMKSAFQATETPLDLYLRGQKDALSEQEKRGALLFFSSRTSCAECHSGAHLSDFKPRSVGAPQAGPGLAKDGDDYGVSNWNQSSLDLYKFKTPQLRNLVVTAPYMHNGMLKTLEDVIEHYNDVHENLNKFDPTSFTQIEQMNYSANHNRRALRFNSVEPEFRIPLKLTEGEKSDLLIFLKKSLFDKNSVDSLFHLAPQTVPSGLPVDN